MIVKIHTKYELQMIIEGLELVIRNYPLTDQEENTLKVLQSELIDYLRNGAFYN